MRACDFPAKGGAIGWSDFSLQKNQTKKQYLCDL
jgi:hypothetical protein